jgi:hypothetical protein
MDALPIIWARFRKALSWHVLIGDYTRCGRRFVEGMETCSDVPMDERTCERCAVLTLHDEGKAA